MDAQTFLNNLGTIADAPGGIQHVRKLILELAVRGALVNQDASEGAQELKATVNGPFQIPQSWSWLRLSDFVKFKVGKTPPTKYPGFWGDSESTMWVSISDMTNGGFVTESARRVTKRARADVFKHDPWPTGTMLMSFKLTIGKVSRLGQPAYFNEAIMSFDSGNPSTNEFLFRVLPLLSQSANAKGAIKGNTLNSDSISNILIPLPPESEQVRIVSKVDELVDLCDELEAAKNKRDSLRTAARKSAIDAVSMATTPRELDSAWVRISKNCSIFYDSQDAISDLRATVITLIINKATNSSQPAEIAPIGNVATIFNGDRSANYPSKEHRVDSGVPFINAGHLRNGQIDFSQMDYITQERFNLLKGGKLVNGDVLFCLRGSLGKSAVVEGIETGTVASSLAIIRPSPRLHSRYLLRFLESQACLKQISRFDNGTAQPNLSARNLAKFELPVPSPDAQESMVKSIDELMQLCDELERSLVTRLTIQQNLAMSVSQFV